MKRSWIAFTLLLGLPLSALACLWDRDTPASEALGLPEVVAAITGRFERNPPLFYQMRLDRVSSQIQSEPHNLADYDDAAVASDRLGLGDEAIAWMNQKRDQLDTLDPHDPDVKNHWYRYHANLGTFLVHQWLRQGADRSKIDEVKSARDHIAQALEINPNAHFGREKYQLQALDWIIHPPSSPDSPYDLPNLLGWDPMPYGRQLQDPREADDAVRGLSGLVILGNAWESVDVFHALSVALRHDTLDVPGNDPQFSGRNILAYLAWLRGMELIDEGHTSLLPDAPRGEALKARISAPASVDTDHTHTNLKTTFANLRAEADAWHAARSAFMLKRLKAGRHPDTDPHFWDGYSEPPAPLSTPQQRSENRPILAQPPHEVPGRRRCRRPRARNLGRFSPHAPGHPRAPPQTRILGLGFLLKPCSPAIWRAWRVPGLGLNPPRPAPASEPHAPAGSPGRRPVARSAPWSAADAL